MPTPHRQPRYRAIADELRRRITAGAIPAGALIPSESALTAEFRVARGTIREAINVLRSEGLVVTEHGRGTYARPTLPIRRLGPDRYRLTPDGAQESDQVYRSRQSDTAEQVRAEYREVPASSELAKLFEVDAGTMLLERRLLVIARGIPQQLTTSYYTVNLVAGTPVVDPAREPWPGGHVAQLRSLGVTVTKIQELVSARIPTAEEAEVLRGYQGIPVLVITRRTWSGEEVVEVATAVVLPVDRNILEYDFSVSSDG